MKAIALIAALAISQSAIGQTLHFITEDADGERFFYVEGSSKKLGNGIAFAIESRKLGRSFVAIECSRNAVNRLWVQANPEPVQFYWMANGDKVYDDIGQFGCALTKPTY